MDIVEQIAAQTDFGKPSAAKRGRRKEWPYVPVIDYGPQVGIYVTRTMQLKGLAYATREEAVEAAAKHIERCRADLAKRLREPRYRALRQQYGLPQEAADLQLST
jgi:hypothetical protein